MVGGGRYLAIAVVLAGCSVQEPASCTAPLPAADYVYVRSHGWHVDIGMSADSITGPLAVFREIFPGAQALMFGYGKRTFLTARADTFSEYLLGPLPGLAVIQVTGVGSDLAEAYPPGDLLVMRLPPGGARALSDFLWHDIALDKVGQPRLVGPADFPGSQFYAAVTGYSLAHTCNTWAANALQAAGVSVHGEGVVFSGQVVARVTDAGACIAR
jgi:hypothetical protein